MSAENQKKTCMLFDLDGTLTDPMEGITKCVQYALAAFGIREPDRNKLTKFIGPPLIPAFKEFYQVDNETAEKMLAKYRERFSATGLYENKLYLGIPELLQKLKAQPDKYMTALATSKPLPFAEKILEHFNIKQYFDILSGATMDESRNTKEAVLAYALDLLRQRHPEARAVMIGDRKFDIEAGKKLSTETVGVLYGYGSKEEIRAADPTHTVKTVTELQSVLLSY